jgi:hypothetical protein
MNLRDAIEKAGQILDEERIEPTVDYEISPLITGSAAVFNSVLERGRRPCRVRENPEEFQFKSGNFDLLCALSDQVPERDRPALFATLSSRIMLTRSYRHRSKEVLGAGAWARCSSELPLVAEFMVRRGDKQLFIRALSEAPPTPGLTLMLRQLEEMIALNLTLFTDQEYTQLPIAMEGVRRQITDLKARPRPSSTIESNIVYHVCREVPELCDSVTEACRKAKFLYVKGYLLPGMNLEVNEDKNRVRTFLQKLGFPQLLIESLDEAEKLYRTAATPFELKSSMGHLRSFLEQLHLQACAALHKKLGGTLPLKWGEALQYLRDHDVLSVKEEQFVAQFYALVSDTSVHPLVAEREYARLIRNMSIEYGLLVLTKLDKLGLN